MKKLIIALALLISYQTFAHISYVSEGALNISLDASTLQECKEKSFELIQNIKKANRALLDSGECYNFKEGTSHEPHYATNILSYTTTNSELQSLTTFNSTREACVKETIKIAQNLRDAKAIVTDVSECIKRNKTSGREVYESGITFN